MEYTISKFRKRIIIFLFIKIFLFITFFIVYKILKEGGYIYSFLYFPLLMILLITESLYTSIKLEEKNIICKSLFKINKVKTIPIKNIKEIVLKKVPILRSGTLKYSVYFLYFNNEYITIDGDIKNIKELFGSIKNNEITFKNFEN